MARVVITGGAGFLGQRVAQSLQRHDSLLINGTMEPIQSICLVDRVIPDGFGPPDLEVIQGDLLTLIQTEPDIFEASDVVIHLASAVSGECEQHLELGLKANVETGIALGQLLAKMPTKPLLIFSSSLAIYGGTADCRLPDVITDATRPNPQNSYGSQKLMLETFYADLARRDALSVRTLRLMTVSVRPGKPNQAASGFLSGMIREPLSGLASNVPVPLDTQVALNSPEQAVDGLISAMGISDQAWGSPLGLNLPGMRLSIQEMRDALEATAGPQALDLLTYHRDRMIEAIVAGWPSHFESARASRLGFRSTESFEAVVQRFQTSK